MFMFQYSPGNTVNNATGFYILTLKKKLYGMDNIFFLVTSKGIKNEPI